ncbi:hypothetical protein [Paenibacillus sp. SI8]|uniref:hypothetical protein n=1 Tax=unclassified Paenibacillus TaxID=185978 RepID=UPI0034674B62
MTQAMAYKEDKDDKVRFILMSLSAGKSRDQLAVELNYKDSKSVDTYMKRKNFEWDSVRKSYFPVKEKKSSVNVLPNPEGRVATILSLFKNGADAKEIALQLKFRDHREMALYLKSKGYVWDVEQSTYVYKSEYKDAGYKPMIKETKEKALEVKQSEPDEVKLRAGGAPPMPYTENSMKLINFLEINKEVLMDIINNQSNVMQIPRYLIPGVCITKSVHMNYGLDQMTREFSLEKNVSQKDIFEVALVDFFKKYGYHKEISVLIGK